MCMASQERYQKFLLMRRKRWHLIWWDSLKKEDLKIFLSLSKSLVRMIQKLGKILILTTQALKRSTRSLDWMKILVTLLDMLLLSTVMMIIWLNLLCWLSKRYDSTLTPWQGKRTFLKDTLYFQLLLQGMESRLTCILCMVWESYLRALLDYPQSTEEPTCWTNRLMK